MPRLELFWVFILSFWSGQSMMLFVAFMSLVTGRPMLSGTLFWVMPFQVRYWGVPH